MALRDLPKYHTISNDLRSRIQSGELHPGDQLPAQHEMAADYGVTVMTLRHALAALEEEGLVHALKGKGTFVSEPRSVRLRMDHLWSFSQEMRHQGVAITTEVIQIQFDAPSEEHSRAAAALQLDEKIVEIVRRRLIGEAPVVLQRSFVPLSAWQKIAQVDLATTSLYDALGESAGSDLARATECFRAVGLNAEDCALLRAPAGQPCLESVRVSFDQRDVPFVYDRAVMLGSVTEVRVERTAENMRLEYGTR